jgi:hypothetical protein
MRVPDEGFGAACLVAARAAVRDGARPDKAASRYGVAPEEL